MNTLFAMQTGALQKEEKQTIYIFISNTFLLTLSVTYYCMNEIVNMLVHKKHVFKIS